MAAPRGRDPGVAAADGRGEGALHPPGQPAPPLGDCEVHGKAMDGNEIKYGDMNTNYEKIKADLLAFGKKNKACVGQYQRLYKADSIEDVIAVVKDNFWWCTKYRDFADVILANREQFAEHQIWANQDVEIQEGVGCLLATDGEFNAKSWDTSTMIIRTSTIECKVNGHSIARYVYDNRIVVADDSIKVEKAK